MLQFDDWRMECYDKDDIFPEAHQIAMSMVMLCGKCENELTLFADWYRKDSAQIRTIFDFPDDKKTKTPFETSRYPAYKLPDDNRLKLHLRDYPKEKFYK